MTFLHLVVGEMAPKSWAIAHPEFSAKFIGIPSRGFIWVFRPLLRWVNEVANRLVSASGVTPVERAAVGGQDAATIRQLVEHSASVGALDETFSSPLTGALGLDQLTVGSLVDTDRAPTAVAAEATVAQV
ncbi:MAG: CNNM domain-containing protein, partial [Dietzia cercidiphylli]